MSLRLEVDKAMDRLQFLHNITRLPEEESWPDGYLPKCLLISRWDEHEYELNWAQLNDYFEELGQRVAELHERGQLLCGGNVTIAETISTPYRETRLDAEILCALGDEELLGKQIAVKMGREPTDGPVKKRIAILHKAGKLKNRTNFGFSRVAEE